jgi:hypothetical protein
MQSSDIGIVLTSKNNYSMLEEFLTLYDYSGITILNIDAGSSDDEIKMGIELCKKNNIDFIQSKNPEMQLCMNQAAKYFLEQGINWFIYTHQDAYPLTINFFDLLKNNYLSSMNPNSIGMIGFNIYHDESDLQHWAGNETKLMTVARTPLELGDGYYRINKTSRVNYKTFEMKPFLIEIPMWSSVLFSATSYIKHINPDKNFQFFLSLDDVAMQYLSQNIPNIVIPELAFAHDQSLKIKHKLPYKSPILNPIQRERLYGRFDHAEVWLKKWGFRFNVYKSLFGMPVTLRKIILKIMNFFFHANFLETIGRKDFSLVQDRYKNTLLYSFYKHDPKNGPYKYYEPRK